MSAGMRKPIGMALVGFGYWGQNDARALSKLPANAWEGPWHVATR
jgi:hypothetical protein